jgi:hypothetical protein
MEIPMRTLILAAGLVLATAGAASAQMPAPADIVKAWDTDKDGSVSKAMQQRRGG